MALIQCSECGTEISDKAAACPKCGCPTASTAPMVPTWPPSPWAPPLHFGTFIGIAGIAILILGTFVPFVQLPIVGAVNLFMNSRGDGILIVGLAAFSILSLTLRSYMVPILAALTSIGIAVYDAYSFVERMEHAQASMAAELEGNPFASIAQAGMQSAQLSIGIYVIVVGAAILISGSFIANARFLKMKSAAGK